MSTEPQEAGRRPDDGVEHGDIREARAEQLREVARPLHAFATRLTQDDGAATELADAIGAMDKARVERAFANLGLSEVAYAPPGAPIRRAKADAEGRGTIAFDVFRIHFEITISKAKPGTPTT